MKICFQKHENEYENNGQKHEVGYENNEIPYGIQKSEKLNDERIYGVRYDLQQLEYEQVLSYINELKKCGIGHFEEIKKMIPQRKMIIQMKITKMKIMGIKNLC
jgi:hypothetical protein